MSYFTARVGHRWAGDAAPPAEGQSPRAAGWESRACFAAQTGPRSSAFGDSLPQPGQPESRTPHPEPKICPLCRGPLVLEDGLFCCHGRCGARWVETSPGHLADLAALPYGACACCEQPQPLVRAGQGAVCPASGRPHLVLPDGGVLVTDAVPHGTCQCCVPPMPLLSHGGKLVCQARPDHQYRLDAGQAVLVSSPGATATPGETLAAIDAALRCNSARVMVNGLFDEE